MLNIYVNDNDKFDYKAFYFAILFCKLLNLSEFLQKTGLLKDFFNP